MKEVIAKLQSLGFSQYEAQAYITLLRRSPLNGYELAKASGIPRANIYDVLNKLEERGAVLRLNMEGSVHYTPVAPNELIRRLRQQVQSSLDDTQQSLSNITSQGEYDEIWNARGYAALLEHATAIIDTASSSLDVAIWPEEAKALAEILQQAKNRGVKLTTLCMAGCPQECGACCGRVFRYQVLPPQSTRWTVLIPDESEVLAGEIGPGEQTLAIRTKQKLLVDLSVWYIRHSIALSAMITDLGDQLEKVISPATRAILAEIGPAGSYNGWLEHMRQAIDRRKN
jgi:predicted transcriptional regulator